MTRIHKMFAVLVMSLLIGGFGAIVAIAPASAATLSHHLTAAQGSAVTLAKSATVTPYNWGGCPSGYSCYYSGQNGTGSVWLAPYCGADFQSPWPIYSVWNRGGNTVWIHDAGWSNYYSVPVGFTASANFGLNYADVPC